MALTPEQLDGVGQVLLTLAPAANPVAPIRAVYPQLPVSRCDASDMRGETAFSRAGGYDVYLVDTASHCWRIVDNLQEAGGVVLAPHD